MTYYQIKSVAPDRAEVRIDGTIGGGWFDEDPVTAKSFAKGIESCRQGEEPGHLHQQPRRQRV